MHLALSATSWPVAGVLAWLVLVLVVGLALGAVFRRADMAGNRDGRQRRSRPGTVPQRERQLR